MMRQYSPAARFRYARVNGRDVKLGTVDVGTIKRVLVDVVIVEAWLPRFIPDYGKAFHSFGHLAAVRSLKNGRRYLLSDCHLIEHNSGNDAR